ncbi:hypothetical protein NSK_006312 [Nannochloropsis salina CCMP1776]|uniref:(S)-ureidoglycine aminohydrolase cupin domain-containing protein n=1 Tax=Nannochloropsis salina CCMP1776 TaxID=1027361 RepID=A0A4D9CXV8_9STRA|nr:hypothetical protein NSK_006312 [Nannochloropsis salina CCMP1776]|eukprot:TFJ82403.1 hypothetical protein NSK_006312 [Nannochloropsis salina CCMP1776]
MRTTSGLSLVFLLLSLVLAGLWAPAASFLLPALPSFVTNFDFKQRSTHGGLSASTTRDSSNMSGIKVVSEPVEATLTEMGVRNWPKWGCEPSEFPWTYGEAETCYILEGSVTVTPSNGQPVTVGAGDLVTFPAGMSCVWKVSKAINKHYKFQ